MWAAAWKVEDEDWSYRSVLFTSVITIRKTTGEIASSVYWYLADKYTILMKECDLLVQHVKSGRLSVKKCPSKLQNL